MTFDLLHSPLSHSILGTLIVAFAAMVFLQSCNTTDPVDAVSAAVSPYLGLEEDAALNARIKAALLLSPVSESFNIAVDSHQGVVLLSGKVADATQRDLAIFVTGNVAGVTQVDSFMFSTRAVEVGTPLSHPLAAPHEPTPAVARRLSGNH